MIDPNIVSTKVWGTSRVLSFDTLDDLILWASEQEKLWLLPRFNTSTFWGSALQDQAGVFQGLKHQAKIAKENASAQSYQEAIRNISSLLRRFADGTALTSDHPATDEIVRFLQDDPELAGYLLLASRSDAENQFRQGAAQNASHFPLVRLAMRRPKGEEKQLRATLEELSRLKNEYESEIEKCRGLRAEQSTATNSNSEVEKIAIATRAEDWKKTLESFKEDWTSLRRVYDEQLGLNAPATYWSTRAAGSRTLAIAFFFWRSLRSEDFSSTFS